MTRRVVDLRLSREQAGLWSLTLVLFALVVYVTWRYVGTFVLGLFLYYVTRPVHARISQRVHSRTLSVMLALVSVALPVLFLVVWTISVAIRGLRDLLGTDPTAQPIPGLDAIPQAPDVIVFAETTVRGLLTDPAGLLADGFGDRIVVAVEALSGSLAVVVNVGIHLFIGLIVVFFLLRDDYRIAAWGRSTFIGDGSVIESFLEAVDRDLNQVYFGNILNAVLTGALGAVTYTLLNLVAPETVRIPEPALFGLLTGVGSLIPVIGIKIVWVPLALVLLADALITDPSALWFVVLFAIVSVVIVDTVPDQLLRPYVSGRSLHVGAVMLAYTIGPLLFGWYGVFLGPLLLVVVVECARHVVPGLVGGVPPTEGPPPDDSDPTAAGEDHAVKTEGETVDTTRQRPPEDDHDGSVASD
ncbi:MULTISPECIES: AI-2E family transporter [Haloferax]|uniref:AI-2E family transporter n=1 Tax=Haloferax marinum TaxID=2666143 RepID=A0A6A8GAC7_9EURY|nr:MULTISPECIES: AI-2E family transporter [Haloferax]KAB1191276.1 AI-2E family transporter [Haloferax sp. CBA1150]MRW98169.1 AI-2E family transporter [Haloferax marinum]